MKFIALEKEIPHTAAGDFAPHLKTEAWQVWRLQQANIIREIYFRADRSEAVLVLECASVEEAQQAINTLPLVQAELITFELIPLKPYPGLARLFAAE